jgi:predicted DNA-binding transcriptional regulator YafY
VTNDPRVRLRQLLELLGEDDAGHPATAKRLADAAGVSMRTVYRDLGKLRQVGVRVIGRTGVGLRLEGPARAPALAAEGEIVARLRGSKAAVRTLRAFAIVEAETADAIRVRATREALLNAVMSAGGQLIVLSPDDLRRDVRASAREIARAHKKA